MDDALRYLLLIRLVVIGGQCVALAAMHGVFGVVVPWPAVGVVLGLLALFTATSWQAARRGLFTPGSHAHYLLQSVADVAALSALVYLTGGASNPFTALFLLPIVFAAAAMPATHSAGVAVLAVGCYTGLMFVQPPLAHAHAGTRLDLHVWGMWYGFVLCALCVALFVARLSRRLRQRDRELAGLREAALETERMLALGTLAAGTAHELGTPLATMALAAGELDVLVRDPAGRAEIERLQRQIARCKDILTRMSADAGNLQAVGGQRTDLGTYLSGIVSEWRQRRPEVRVQVQWRGTRPAPSIVADRVITQAIVNVLDNAADAAAGEVEVAADWDAAAWRLAISDDGDGIAPELRARLGIEALSTKASGMGIGLLLARSIVERLGGALEFEAAPGRGTRARIEVPLAPLAVA